MKGKCFGKSVAKRFLWKGFVNDLFDQFQALKALVTFAKRKAYVLANRESAFCRLAT